MQDFRRSYTCFLDENGLTPLNFSPDIRPYFERNPVSLRYVRIHDMIHVLLGLDTSIAGEIGVYAFVGEQNYCRTLNWAARFASAMRYVFFWKIHAINAARARGQQLGQRMRPLIEVQLENLLQLPLDEVRKQLLREK